MNFHQKGYIAWNIKPFSAPFFNHFIQPSRPPIAKWKSLLGLSRGQLPHKKWFKPFVAYPPYDDIKISPQPICSSKPHKHDNYDKLTNSFPLLPVPPSKPVHQAIHYPMANFGPLFDHYLTQGHQELGNKVGVWTKILPILNVEL